MGDEMTETRRGYYSLLRWRPDVVRDEQRNVAILFVDPEEDSAAVRAAPLSSLTPSLRDQGLLDKLVVNLEHRLISEAQYGVKALEGLHESLERSLIVTAPESVAVVGGPEVVLQSLYRAFLSARPAPRSLTKGVVLDQVIERLRRQGQDVFRGEERGDFIFDAVIRRRRQQDAVLAVMSFASPRKDWSPILHDAGYFLYALEHVPNVRGTAILQRPLPKAHKDAGGAFNRVRRWFRDADVPVLSPDQLEPSQLVTALG